MWIERYKVSEQPKQQPRRCSPSVMHFSPAHHLFPGVIRKPCWRCKCHLKSDSCSRPAAQHPRTLPAPRAARQSWVYRSGKLSIPKPSLLGIHLVFRGWHRNLGVGIREAMLAKGSAPGTWVRRKRTGRKGRDDRLGWQWMAMPCKTLIWSSGSHLGQPDLCIKVFLRYITFRNVFSAFLSKNDRQPYNIRFVFFFSIFISEVLWEI